MRQGMASAISQIAKRQFSTTASMLKLVAAPTQVFGIEGRYATALYSAASKSKKLEAVEQDMGKISSLLKTDKRLGDFLGNPTYKKQAKQAAFAKLLTSLKVSDLTQNMFGLLAENGRLSKTGAVMDSFATLMSAHRGEVQAEVVTARPLESKESQELQTVLKAFLKPGQKLQMTFSVDPSIIGGMTVAIGDKFVDMSTAKKIRMYHEVLKQGV